ncbi:hypothetical protein [Cronobacter dublinensis]|uniref:hypothetical protein n=1 Tax=Cronobacter dublinensis TaxID=413497 RepID=UPI00131A4587|nr:hypothetical protein [Cronobacter dublinensis]
MEFNMTAWSLVFICISSPIFASEANPQFSDYSVAISSGPFTDNIVLASNQQRFTDKWKHIMQRELLKKVNFAGHYRFYLSWNGELPQECGDERWVCGWVIDKTTGKIVSELPEFNGNHAYLSYHANGTPVPEAFEPAFYPQSTMLWINGNTAPLSNLNNLKCEYRIYNFKYNIFSLIDHGYPCDTDYGDDTSASK